MLADFGVSVIFSPGATYPHRNSDTETITAIFDAEYIEIQGDEMIAASKAPAIIARTSDAADAQINSMAEIGVDRYKVVGVEPDGNGMTVLILEGPN